jgi:N-hydroxyarylamine O-acetyltransferase
MTGRSSPSLPPEASVGAYLDRIGVAPAEARHPTAATLERLQRRHLFAVPFENLDVVRGERVTVDPADAYEKVVRRGRGGFCYELNGLFGTLLSELGFDVRYVEGRVRRDDAPSAEAGDTSSDGSDDPSFEESGDDDAFGPPYDHLALLVAVRGETYLADVGFGRFARVPLPLSGAARSDVEGTYRVRRVGDGVYEAQERPSGAGGDSAGDAGASTAEWTPVYRVTDVARSLDEFRDRCAYHQSSPESPFAGGPFCTRPTPEGRLTFSGDALTVTEGAAKRREDVPSADRARVLRERFGMVNPPAAF